MGYTRVYSTLAYPVNLVTAAVALIVGAADVSPLAETPDPRSP